MFGQAPPTYFLSITATRFPCEASDQESSLPGAPLPRTTTSYSSGCDMFFSFEVPPQGPQGLTMWMDRSSGWDDSLLPQPGEHIQERTEGWLVLVEAGQPLRSLVERTSSLFARNWPA